MFALSPSQPKMVIFSQQHKYYDEYMLQPDSQGNTAKIALFHKEITGGEVKIDLKDHIIVLFSNEIKADTSDVLIQGIAIFAFRAFLKAPNGSIKLRARKCFALETVFQQRDNFHSHCIYILKKDKQRFYEIDCYLKKGVEDRCCESVLEALSRMVSIKEDPTGEKRKDPQVQEKILRETYKILAESPYGRSKSSNPREDLVEREPELLPVQTDTEPYVAQNVDPNPGPIRTSTQFFPHLWVDSSLQSPGSGYSVHYENT